MAVVVIIGGGGAGGGGNNGQRVLDDGTIVDEQGATVAKFDNVVDAIAYLQHMTFSPAQLAEAKDDRA